MRIFHSLLLMLVLAPLPGTAAGPADPEAGHAVVLMYHRFGDARFPSTNIRIEQFEAQLDHLADNGYTVWPLERIVDHLTAGRPIPDRTVAVTVDDAYLSVYENGWPLLRARGIPFTVFVSTDAVDRGLADFVSWQQMREMARTGVRFANHSAGHDHLASPRPGESAAAWRERVKADLQKAERRLAAELGQRPDGEHPLFAYPYGEYSEPLAALVGELGYIAFGQQSGPLGPLSDRRALPRFPINEHYGAVGDFAEKVATLPLPVLRSEPWDPVVAANPPTLRLRIAETKGLPLDRLTCYASGQGQVPHRWVDRENGVLEVTAPQPLAEGRSRYNCTAPAGGGRWYWFSQLWLIGEPE